jgi:hypothetical protein
MSQNNRAASFVKTAPIEHEQKSEKQYEPLTWRHDKIQISRHAA